MEAAAKVFKTPHSSRDADPGFLADDVRRKIRVLVADDHSGLRKSFVRLFEDLPDIEIVSEASDGEMAVERAMATNPDVVLIDVSMPRLDGVEATRRIAANVRGVRIIGLSMYGESEIGEAILKAGAVVYLRKDVPFDVLVSTIRGQQSSDNGEPGTGKPR